MKWSVSPHHARDVVDENGTIICTTYGPDAERTALEISRVGSWLKQGFLENPRKHPAGFTMGPWVIDQDKPTMVLDAPFHGAFEIIAQVSTEANARLIAAGPALYSALERIASGLYEDGGTESICGDGAAAIAQRALNSAKASPAEGETPAGGDTNAQ